MNYSSYKNINATIVVLNDPPTSTPFSRDVTEKESVNIQLTSSDPENEQVSYEIVNKNELTGQLIEPSNFTNTGLFNYTLSHYINPVEKIKYNITDGTNIVDSFEITLNINGIPVITNQTYDEKNESQFVTQNTSVSVDEDNKLLITLKPDSGVDPKDNNNLKYKIISKNLK